MKDKIYLDLAFEAAKKSGCFRTERHVGAVVVKGDKVLATGCNGPSECMQSCIERGYCMRQKNNIKSGTQLEVCYGVCAEVKAIFSAISKYNDVSGAILYSTHHPCDVCTRTIIECGIRRVVYKLDYPNTFCDVNLKDHGVVFKKFK